MWNRLTTSVLDYYYTNGCSSEFGTFLFKSLDHDAKSKFIFASGVLNYLWQIWGQFWRTLWLTYLLGGENLWKIRIHPYFQNKTENEAIYFILFLFKCLPLTSILKFFKSLRSSHIKNCK